MSPFGANPLLRTITGCAVPTILFLVILVFVLKSPSVIYARHLRAGYYDFDSGAYSSVVSDCNEALAARPHTYEALLLRGTAYDKLNQDKRAIADDIEALSCARTPLDRGVAYYNRGLSYERMGENSKAATDFTECLHNTPGNYQALFERADCYRNTGNPAGAISDVNSYLQRGHSSYYAFYIRGQAYVEQKRWQESVTDFKHELQLKPDDGIGWGSLGWSQYMVRDLDGAIESDRTALRLRPNLSYARYNLALCFAVQNRWDEAQPEYETATQKAKPAELKSALEDIQNALRQSPGSSALANAKQLLVSARK